MFFFRIHYVDHQKGNKCFFHSFNCYFISAVTFNESSFWVKYVFGPSSFSEFWN